MEVNAALLQDALTQLNQVIKAEVNKIKASFVNKSAFDKFSSGTVDALEQEREKIIQSEKITADALSKQKKRNDLHLRQLELKLEGKINALLSGDVQDKFDIFTDSFDSKLRSLTKRIDNVVQSTAAAEP